ESRSAIDKSISFRSLVVCLLRKIRQQQLLLALFEVNSGTWALPQTDLVGLESFHRKQLRQLIGVRYPNWISSEKLYDWTGTKPSCFAIAGDSSDTFLADRRTSQQTASWKHTSCPATKAHGVADGD
ncbi:hypothetical protein L916_19560, partial [Phytophthora nicotianae]